MDQEREDYDDRVPPPWWLPSLRTLMLLAAVGMALAVLADAKSVTCVRALYRLTLEMQN